METIPLAIVTVPSPLSTSVTFGPEPVPPPGMLAKTEPPISTKPSRRMVLRRSLANF
jgi:hypothetical protein